MDARAAPVSYIHLAVAVGHDPVGRNDAVHGVFAGDEFPYFCKEPFLDVEVLRGDKRLYMLDSGFVRGRRPDPGLLRRLRWRGFCAVVQPRLKARDSARTPAIMRRGILFMTAIL